MATADIDNVITLQTGATSEAQPGPSGRSKDSTSALRAKRYRRARKQGGKRDGRATARLPNRDGEPAPGGQAPQGENQNEIKPSVTVHVAPPLTADPDVRASVQRHGRGIGISLNHGHPFQDGHPTAVCCVALIRVHGTVYGVSDREEKPAR